MPELPDPIPCARIEWHNILAKPQESLIAHTWYVLSRLADQLRLRPTLAQDLGEPQLWHWLYWGTFLHDFGKCATGFQAMLKEPHNAKKRWPFRHEALSLAFVDWLFPRGNPDRLPVIAVIACHHKDADEIREKYGSAYSDYPEDELAGQIIGEVRPADQHILYQWLTTCAWDWAEQLGFAPYIQPADMPSVDKARTPLQARQIHDAIEDLVTYTKKITFRENAHQAHLGMLLRGMILIADHAGSASSKQQPFTALDVQAATQQLFAPTVTPHPHQTQAAHSQAGSALLISPTGSGKTEAALLWLNQQATLDSFAPARVFYVLPYQASMNAMYKRLGRTFEQSLIGLQHGHAQQAVYFAALHNELSTETAQNIAKLNEEVSRLHRYPLNIQSPYQMLKSPYQIKGHEALFASFQGGRFIFDEIHAYEAERLAMIVKFIEFLRRYANARFFIMSATMPDHVQTVLKEALPDLQFIQADQDTYTKFQRHRIHLLDGSLADEANLAQIQMDAQQGKSVLVCCNTIKHAKEIHALLCTQLPEHPIILVHSRFNAKDRMHKESEIMHRVGVEARDQQHGVKPIVVATQVVEVSLNIDMDTLYTENAPLEALLQRFGRVNRARSEKSIADVFVVREQPDSVTYIYDQNLLNATLTKLAVLDGQVIDESAVDTWLNEIYAGTALEQWWATYEKSAGEFTSAVLDTLRPFATDKDIEQLFYQMFKEVEVLPADSYPDYTALLQQRKFLDASMLLIPISWQQYKRLKNAQKVWAEPFKQGNISMPIYLVEAEYSSDSGLDIEGALFAEPPLEAD